MQETVEGFYYFNNFIDVSEEKFILKNIQILNWQQVKMYGITAKRRVIHFGFNYLFDSKKITPTVEAPKFLHGIMEKVAYKLSIPYDDIDEILITEYSPGAGIGWHRDAIIFGDKILGISLKNSCVFKLRNIKNHNKIFKISLEPRSAYILSGEARTQWQHSISPLKLLRYSLTFRTLKK